jgi:hypothetical protein
MGHPERGSIWLRVNDELRQQGDLRQQMWKVPETISYHSLAPNNIVVPCLSRPWPRRPRSRNIVGRPENRKLRRAMIGDILLYEGT